MKNLVFLFLFASFAAQSQPLVKAVVSSAFDGDGCRVRFSPKEKTTEVRFRHIDAPECRGYSVKAQPYGNIARDSLRAWILKKEILLDTSKVDGKSRDIYGRLYSLFLILRRTRLVLPLVWWTAVWLGLFQAGLGIGSKKGY